MKCGKCTDPDYCACADFFTSLRAYWSGAMDHLMTREQIAHRNASRPHPQGAPRMTAQELISPEGAREERVMETNPPDPESVAAGLTPFDREAVLKPAIKWTLGDRLSLAIKGLSFGDCLNDFGLAVRAALQSKETK